VRRCATQKAFIPNVFQDITNHVEKKLTAMAGYKSQLRAAPHPRKVDMIRMLAHVRGAVCGLAAAEAFCLVREISPPGAVSART
jgi:LmbE family N-acetylglucosaminyl deacetylase